MSLPTNMNNAPLGTNAVGGVNNFTTLGVQIGAISTVTLQQGTDFGAGLTSEVVLEWRAPFAGIIREGTVWAYSCTGTTTVDLYNLTTTTTMIAAQTVTSATSARVSTIASASFAEGDQIQVRITTAASTGACKGAAWILTIVPTTDSSKNTFV